MNPARRAREQQATSREQEQPRTEHSGADENHPARQSDGRQSLLSALNGALIVSCQPVRGGALDDPTLVAALVRAAQAGGARGIRAEGVDDLKAVRAVTSLPVVGLIKTGFSSDEPFITTHPEHVDALTRAGADVIAFDATRRPRATPVSEMIATIHGSGKVAMADCATFEEGMAAAEAGADFVATTLSGYTANTRSRETPDFELIERLSKSGIRTIAEGHIRTPEQAAEARRCGAFSITVGSAITRPELITEWFTGAIAAAGWSSDSPDSRPR